MDGAKISQQDRIINPFARLCFSSGPETDIA